MKNLTNKSSSIQFNVLTQDQQFFFTKKIVDLVNKLSTHVSSTSSIQLFPDATYKTVGLPNGLALIENIENAMIFPSLLRDPGCGFLLFTISLDPSQDNQEIYSKINSLIHNQMKVGLEKNKKEFLMKYFFIDSLNEVLKSGLSPFLLLYPELMNFDKINFFIDDDVDIKTTPDEDSRILDDYLKVSNTIEIKKNDKKEIYGFIHSGTDSFPYIITARFAKEAYLQALNNGFTSEDLDERVHGIKLSSKLGYQYYQWLKMAMNFSVFNRFSIFLSIKNLLEENFQCKVNLVNDHLHAGVFLEDNKLISTRGVQIVNHDHQNCFKNKMLIAGQRETISYLVESTSSAQSEINMIPHGTSYQILEDYPYSKHFSDDEIEYYLSLAKKALYNTQPKFEESIPFTFNLIRGANFFIDNKLIRKLDVLEPIINIQSDSLIDRLVYSEQLQKSKE